MESLAGDELTLPEGASQRHFSTRLPWNPATSFLGEIIALSGKEEQRYGSGNGQTPNWQQIQHNIQIHRCLHSHSTGDTSLNAIDVGKWQQCHMSL